MQRLDLITYSIMPNGIPVSIREGKSSEKGESSTRVEAVSAAVEATRFAVFGCRNLRTIGWWLIRGGDAGEDGGKEVSWCSG